MFKIDGIKHFINKTFRDEIVDVKLPREDWFVFNEISKLESYVVTVVYKYAGPKDVVFDIEDEEEIIPSFFLYSVAEQNRLRKLSQERTLKSARSFYERKKEQMMSRKNKTK